MDIGVSLSERQIILLKNKLKNFENKYSESEKYWKERLDDKSTELEIANDQIKENVSLMKQMQKQFDYQQQHIKALTELLKIVL